MYEGKIEAVKSGTDYAKHITQANSLFIYTDSQSEIKAIIMAQSRESYHNETKTKIRDNLIQISSLEEHIKLIYCLAHRGIKGDKMANNLAKTASKKSFSSSSKKTYLCIKLKRWIDR